jgi:transposase InsO family protein
MEYMSSVNWCIRTNNLTPFMNRSEKFSQKFWAMCAQKLEPIGFASHMKNLVEFDSITTFVNFVRVGQAYVEQLMKIIKNQARGEADKLAVTTKPYSNKSSWTTVPKRTYNSHPKDPQSDHKPQQNWFNRTVSENKVVQNGTLSTPQTQQQRRLPGVRFGASGDTKPAGQSNYFKTNHREELLVINQDPSTEKPLRILLEGITESIQVLGDSGATLNVIGDKFCQQFNIPVEELNPPKKVNWINGTTIELSQRFRRNAKLLVHNNESTSFEIEWYVMPNYADQAILGKPFLEERGIDVHAQLGKLCLPPENPLKLSNVNNDLPSEKLLVNVEHDVPKHVIDRLTTRVTRLKDKEDPTRPMNIRPVKVEEKMNMNPIRAKPTRYSLKAAEFLEDQTRKQLENGWIYPNPQARWASRARVVSNETGDPNRVVIDLRQVNMATQTTAVQMPNLEIELGKLSTAKVFSKIDFKKGYWQIPLAKESQELFSFVTHSQVFTPNRLPQGWKNSVGIFQSIMKNLLSSIPNIILYIDDILIYSTTLEEHEQTLEKIFTIFEKAHVIINWEKSCFYQKSIDYCGRRISAEGIQFSPEMVSGIVNMPSPTTAGELMAFVHSANYVRTGIPNFAREIEPLVRLLNEFHDRAGNRTRRSIEKKTLQKLWTEIHQKAFDEIKMMLKHQITQAYPDPKQKLFVISDASAIGWAIILAQTEAKELHKPFYQRDYSILACQSGVFRGSSERWDTISKECFPIVNALDRFDYLLHRTDGFTILTDNMTLSKLLTPAGPKADSGGQAYNRLFRWSMRFQAYSYTIEHIPGVSNIWLDLLSRLTPIQKEQLLQIHSPSTETVHEPLRRKELIKQAHNSFSGHRSIAATLHVLKKHYFWDTLEADVRAYIANCMHCLVGKHRNPKSVPIGHSHIRGHYPGMVVNLDFLHMVHDPQQGSDTPKYACIVRDDFSGFTLIYACAKQTAEVVADILVDWCSTYCIPKLVVSDQGQPFLSRVFTRVLEKFKLKHHMVSAYHHNDSPVERTNRVILESFKTLLSELRWIPEQWDMLIPLVQRVINHTPSDRLAGYAPIEVFTRLNAQSIFDLIEQAQPFTLLSEEHFEHVVLQFMDSILEKDQEDIPTIQEKIAQRELRNRQARNRFLNKVEYKVGDLVMQHRGIRGLKLESTYQGPKRVITIVNPYVCELEDVRTGAKHLSHIARLIRYKDKSTGEITQADLEQNKYYALGNRITEIVNITELQSQDKPSTWQVHVRLHGDETIYTYDLKEIQADYPTLLTAFCESNPEDPNIQRLLRSSTIQIQLPSSDLNGGSVAQTQYITRTGRKTKRTFQVHT